MHIFSTAKLLSLALYTSGLVLACGVAACGSDAASPAATSASDAGVTPVGSGGSNNDLDAGTATGSTSTTTTMPTSTVSTSSGTCPQPTVGIAFSPMYSAFIPDSTAHTFQVPAVTDDGSAATWSVSDPAQAQLVAQNFNGLSGVMITVSGPGTGTGTTKQLTVIASKSDGSCGTAVLNITATTEDDWKIGDARYNNGVSLALGAPPGADGGRPAPGGRPDGGGAGGPRTASGGSFFERDGGTACTNCHGPTATNGPYKDVSHTPEQTAGFSDDQLIQIITKGEIPDGGYFDPTVIIASCDGGAECTARARAQWHSFHQWSDIAPDQYPGMIAYLRSLQPQGQTGSSANFGGGGRRFGDGGMPQRGGDGGTRRDAGAQ
jgi:hypothetical protein